MKKRLKLKADEIIDIFSCCTHYKTNEYELGYAMYKPFKVLYCKNCETTHLICNKFLAFIFNHFLSYFWDGSIILTGEICKINLISNKENENE